MKLRSVIFVAFFLGLGAAAAGIAIAVEQTALQAQNERLFRHMAEALGLTPEQMGKVRAIFARSGYMGQGNPAITVHPVTAAQCEANLAQKSIAYANPEFEKICGAKYMVPLYDPATQKPEDATVCIDQFEFPDIPCEYPVVWTKAREAAETCEAEGKRICDAHEWEGACAGALEPPDYDFALAKGVAPNVAVERMRAEHNRQDAPKKNWSYGPEYRTGICATGSQKSPDCPGGSWSKCGSNTYPAGNFPDCHSPLGAYDLNGNAAEHMNLPLGPDEMASGGSKTLGYTEMKGSWFVFDRIRAHEDWCRWRAPFWHGSRVMDPASHANYHLGFRCCKTLDR